MASFSQNNPNQAASTIPNTGFRIPEHLLLRNTRWSHPKQLPLGPIPGRAPSPMLGSSLGLLSSTGAGISGSIRKQPSPYTENYNLGVEYQLPQSWLIGVSYVGNRGLQLPYAPIYNQLPTSALALGGQLLTSVPNHSQRRRGSDRGADLQATIQKRYLLSPYPQFTSVGGIRHAGGHLALRLCTGPPPKRDSVMEQRFSSPIREANLWMTTSVG